MHPYRFLTALISLTPIAAHAIIVIGHRGASGYEPENTLRSFKRAIEMGAPMIELDVHLCKSGEVVVIHDATIERTTTGTGEVKDLVWSELKQYDAGKGEHIPLLSDVFDLVNRRAIITIELKDIATDKPVAALIDHYVQNKQWSYQDFIISSFDHYAVRTFHQYCPSVKTGVLFEGNPIGYADIAQRAYASYAMMYYDIITKEFVADAHARGIKVFAYTVNDKKIAQHLKKLNVDGIFTDYPDLLKQAL